ncbi:MAG TPA: glycosyltransferase [Dokdonella sp.]|uniref:glycosyltransferase n=1 Tax=Dokdonella sp. TaxID=2291710 RepID=UPI002D7E3CD9|nr:glycosyltransferase [Dokdonella sp.]HET9034109.1 glycosyltransferase [Dokdonella sp.]
MSEEITESSPERGSHEPKWIAIVGPFSFPEGGAAARRILGMAQSAVAAGYRVTIASGQRAQADEMVGESRGGIRVVSLDERDSENWPRPIRRLRYSLMGRRTVSWLSSEATPPSAVILYSGYTPYLLRLRKWCKSNSLPLFFDAVEWYQPSMWLGWLSPYQLNIELAMRYLICRTDGVIAISSYLEKHFMEARLPVVLIPPTLDVHTFPEGNGGGAEGVLRLCYVGTPGSKDALDVIVSAVLDVANEYAGVRLDIAGSSVNDVMALPTIRNRCFRELPQEISVHGQLCHDGAVRLIGESDFSVLVRKPGKVAMAGFPTKVVESLAAGTPVIANISSDLGVHVIDGRTGFVVNDHSVSALQSTLRRAIELPLAQRNVMREHCRAHALANFDYRVFAGDLAQLVKGR